MLNISTEIILLCFDKMKDVTLMGSIIAKKKDKNKKQKKQTNTDIPKLTINQY